MRPGRRSFALPVGDRWRPQFSARSGTDMARMWAFVFYATLRQ